MLKIIEYSNRVFLYCKLLVSHSKYAKYHGKAKCLQWNIILFLILIEFKMITLSSILLPLVQYSLRTVLTVSLFIIIILIGYST